jgi:hypothetical protein
MAKTTWTEPKIHGNYGELWQSLLSRADLPGGIGIDRARQVHVHWRSLGKRATKGRL